MDKIVLKKIGLGCGIALGIIFLTAFLSSQIIYPLLFGRPKNIETPDLVGMSFSKARKNLSEIGLHAVVQDSVWSESEKIDTILEQDPKPGKMLKPESSIYLRLSRGSKMVGVPTLVGLNYHDAYFTLRSVGLKGAVSDSLYSDSYSINTVISCMPTVGSKIEKGSTVRLKLSRGPEPILRETESATESHTSDAVSNE